LDGLGELNGVARRADEPVSEEWGSAVEAPGALEVALKVEVEPEPLIEAGLGGKTVAYKPTAEELSDCEQP